MKFAAGDAGVESYGEKLPEKQAAPGADGAVGGDDVERLHTALKKERGLRKDAEKSARANRTVEQRIAELETRNHELELQSEVSHALKAAIDNAGDGMVVDREAVDDWLADANINSENYQDVVSRAVKRNTRPDTLAPITENKQPRGDVRQKNFDVPSLSAAFA